MPGHRRFMFFIILTCSVHGMNGAGDVVQHCRSLEINYPCCDSICIQTFLIIRKPVSVIVPHPVVGLALIIQSVKIPITLALFIKTINIIVLANVRPILVLFACALYGSMLNCVGFIFINQLIGLTLIGVHPKPNQYFCS